MTNVENVVLSSCLTWRGWGLGVAAVDAQVACTYEAANYCLISKANIMERDSGKDTRCGRRPPERCHEAGGESHASDRYNKTNEENAI